MQLIGVDEQQIARVQRQLIGAEPDKKSAAPQEDEFRLGVIVDCYSLKLTFRLDGMTPIIRVVIRMDASAVIEII